jgi:hypothetical protein
MAAMTGSLADLTPSMQTVLIRAYTQGIELEDPRVSARTIGALEARGLIHLRTSKKGRTSWRTTPTGYGLVVLQVPRFLAARSEYGYTHLPSKAMRHEPEAA